MIIEEGRFNSEYSWHTTFEQTCATAIRAAYACIEDRYGESNIIRDHLPYHQLLHTAQVTERVVSILTALHSIEPHVVSAQDIFLGALSASHHDIVQQNLFAGDDLLKTRVSEVGVSEFDSAQWLIAIMESQRDFTPSAIATVEPAIRATIPKFDLGIVTQPYIVQSMQEVERNGGNPLIIPTLAMADLGDAGMSKNIISVGNALFRERYFGITSALMTYDLNIFSRSQRETICDTMRTWANGQIVFVQGREQQFEEQLHAFFPQSVRAVVRAQFPYFDFSADAVVERERNFSHNMDFSAIVSAMGYKV